MKNDRLNNQETNQNLFAYKSEQITNNENKKNIGYFNFINGMVKNSNHVTEKQVERNQGYDLSYYDLGIIIDIVLIHNYFLAIILTCELFLSNKPSKEQLN